MQLVLQYLGKLVTINEETYSTGCHCQINNSIVISIKFRICRILPDMMNTEEEEISSSSIVYNQDDLMGAGDPLSDPLALDENLDNGDYGSAIDANTSADGEIILVDVDSLKSAFTTTETNAIDQYNGQPSQSSASSSHAHTKCDDSKKSSKLKQCKDDLVIKDIVNVVTTDNLDNEQNDKVQHESVVLGSILGESLLDIVDMPVMASGGGDIGDNGTANSNHLDIHFEPVNITLVDEVNEEGEGARSDGSDSGFGLELSSSIVPEKSVTSPVGK